MDPAGMVHALEEVRRVLVPDGVLIDMRPFAEHWRVEVVSMRGFQGTGWVEDLPEQVNGDLASNEAMRDVESRGWFQREREEFFPLFYSWDTPSEMEEFIDNDWADFIGLGEKDRKATRSAWALGDADSRVRVRVQILISRWKKR
jgi:hypothetical protein